MRGARGGQRRRGTVKLQWHFMANPGVEQDCLLATLQSVDEAKRSLDETSGSVLSVSENSCYSLTADLPRLLIMLPCDVILTHTEVLTTSVCRAQICPQRVGQCFYLALFWACSLAMMFCCQAFGCHANFSALNHNLSTAGDQKPFQV